MQVPSILQGESLKRLLQGAFTGFLATVVIGFGWGGWTLGSTAKEMAGKSASSAVICASRPWVSEIKLPERSSVHLTGRPSSRAACNPIEGLCACSTLSRVSSNAQTPARPRRHHDTIHAWSVRRLDRFGRAQHCFGDRVLQRPHVCDNRTRAMGEEF